MAEATDPVALERCRQRFRHEIASLDALKVLLKLRDPSVTLLVFADADLERAYRDHLHQAERAVEEAITDATTAQRRLLDEARGPRARPGRAKAVAR